MAWRPWLTPVARRSTFASARPTAIQPALAQAISQCIEPNRDRRLRSLDQFLKAIAAVKHEDGK